MTSNYDVGTRAWQPDATDGWVASEVIKKQIDGDKVVLTFKLENGEVRTPTHSHIGQRPPKEQWRASLTN